MRIKLDNENMDLVMDTVRGMGIKIEDAVNFLLNNPDIIMNTRGVKNGKNCKNYEVKTCKEERRI